VHVGTTATTMGADLLVSELCRAAVRLTSFKYDLVKANAKATTLTPKRLDVVSSALGSKAGPLAGN